MSYYYLYMAIGLLLMILSLYFGYIANFGPAWTLLIVLGFIVALGKILADRERKA
jgi:hypothetical protein